MWRCCVLALFHILAIGLGHLPLAVAQSTVFDQYGGYTDLRGTDTGFFHTEKIDQQWWFISPEGHAMFLLGVSAVNTVSDFDQTGYTFEENVRAKYVAPGFRSDTFGTDWKARWAYYARQRLKSWGFNNVGTFSHYPVVAQMYTETIGEPPMGGLTSNRLSQVITNRAGRESMGADRPWRVKNIYGPVWTTVKNPSPYFPDVFDANFAASQRHAARQIIQDDPWVAYVFMDQTDEMRGVNESHPHLGFVAMATAFEMPYDAHAFLGVQTYNDATLYTKYAVRDFLQAKYGDLTALNQAWGTRYTSWDSDGGWGTGTGVLDEDGRHLGQWTGSDPHKSGYPAVREDLDAFATVLMRQWYRTVYTAFKEAGSPYMLSTNNLDHPKSYVYEGLRSKDGRAVYADIVMANDAEAGLWSDWLDRPFSASNLGGFFTADNDSPLGYVGTVHAVAANDADRTLTITCNSCNFYWAGDPNFDPVHAVYTQFSSLPATIVRGNRHEPQKYRSRVTDWLSPTQFVVRQASYFNGRYEELRDGLRVGDTFKRITHFNTDSPFETQDERGHAYQRQLQNAVIDTSPNGTYFRVGANLWAYKDTSWFYWEVYNFGLVTLRDNAYDGVEACFRSDVDPHGFRTVAEATLPHITASCFGNFLGWVQQAHDNVYALRPEVHEIPSTPRPIEFVSNGNFEQSADGWMLGSTGSFEVVHSESKRGTASLQLRDADTAQYTPSALQSVGPLSPGTYILRAWMKTQDLGANTAATNSGIRVAMRDDAIVRGSRNIATTPILGLTHDWIRVETTVQITSYGDYTVAIESFNKPDGLAWIDQVSLRKLP